MITCEVVGFTSGVRVAGGGRIAAFFLALWEWEVAKDQHRWHTHPLFVGVASTLLVTFILSWVPAVREYVWWVVGGIWWLATYRISMPAWALFLIASIGVPTVIRWLQRLMPDKEPTWEDYRRDEFVGIVWEWSYFNGKIWQPEGYCPQDDTLLVIEDEDFADECSATCESCGRKFGPYRYRKVHFIRAICRQVDRKIRTGEWKAVVASQTEHLQS